MGKRKILSKPVNADLKKDLQEKELLDQQSDNQIKNKKRKKKNKDFKFIHADSSDKDINKSKKTLNANDHDDSTVLVESMVKKKRKKRDNKGIVTDLEVIDPVEQQVDDQSHKKMKIKGKDKQMKSIHGQFTSNNEDVVNVSDQKPIRKSKKKQDIHDHIDTSMSLEPNTSDRKKVTKNKKIIFKIDKSQDESTSSINQTKNKTFLNEDEADVKDEDIDKFCDEVGDDDNELYESWIQQLETKLHGNSKKGK